MPRPKKTDYIRYVCSFTIKQYETLKEKSDEEGIPIAHQIRTAIDNYLNEFDINENNINKKNLVNHSIEDNKNFSEPKNDLNKYNLVISLEKLIDLKNRQEISEEEYQVFKSKLIEI